MAELHLHIEDVPIGGPGFPAVTLAIPAHQTVSVVGRDGSGADRLGPIALGLMAPTSGRVTVLGTDLSTLKRGKLLAYRRRVGYLPAGDGLLQNLTLHQNVALPLRFGSDYSESEIAGRMTIMLAAVDLAAAKDLRPARASDEQRRRAALARALAFDPDLVVMVDPFAGLPDSTARNIIETARGGDVPGGSRRTVLIVGPVLPSTVARRVDACYHLSEQGLVREN